METQATVIKSKLERAFTFERGLAFLILAVFALGLLLLRRDIALTGSRLISTMPAEIQYAIKVIPMGATYYTATYTKEGAHALSAPEYWTFDHRSKTWSHYDEQLWLVGMEARVDKLSRIYTTITINEEK